MNTIIIIVLVLVWYMI